MSIGSQIKQLRFVRVMPARELAKRAGVTTTSIFCYEREKRVPSLDTQIKIANALGVQVRELWREMTLEEVLAAMRIKGRNGRAR
jgi:DNA-binding XRE family transcriptional regulator